MKNYCFSFTPYEVANLYNAVDCLLELFEDGCPPQPSEKQYECLVALRDLFEKPTLEYLGCESYTSVSLIFDEEGEEE